MGKKREEDTKAQVPGWMVSFGDMMTLILTFFILLVSLSKERQMGLVAKGVGSFVTHMQSFGLDSLMSESEKREVFNEVRSRFNLPPEEDPTQQTDPDSASNEEVLRADSVEKIKPHDEIFQPAVALFDGDQVELSSQSRRYLDLLSSSLKPGNGQVLILEGQAQAGSDSSGFEAQSKAHARAQAVRRYLIETHGFEPGRVEARAWLKALPGSDEERTAVDARLILPPR